MEAKHPSTSTTFDILLGFLLIADHYLLFDQTTQRRPGRTENGAATRAAVRCEVSLLHAKPNCPAVQLTETDRHGIRLDLADKQWHLSSPTPYDPPLTYHGWQQAKNLGARIASIIRDKVNEDEAAERQNPDSSGNRKRKRYKVVIHSSPFLRCIQTSVAISAGLAQDSTPFGPTNTDTRRPMPVQSPVLSPRTRPTIVTDTVTATKPPAPIRKSVLRLDAFLGEWLSPTYYELITPPPESVMMLASAKADLLRREDYTHYPSFSSHTYSSSQGHLSQGQLWSPIGRSSQASSFMSDDLEPLSRSTSMSSQSNFSMKSCSTSSSEASGYVAPVPHYAVSNNNTIPPGYVAHARDACVDIDYQWDSTRSPLEWEDGGTFPEEWTAMHRRFRRGIQNLVDWYSTAENPTEMVTKTASRNGRRASMSTDECAIEDEDDIETEAVVILVSHGAGCNAMIGAITHQPVLMDVGMASLTLAVRKPLTERSELSSEREKESIPVHMLYDLKMFANTDHLRSPVPTPSASTAGLANGTGGRSRYSYSVSSSLNNFSFNNDNSGSRNSSANAALSSLRKGSSATPRFSYMNNSSTNGGGITVGSGVTSFQTRYGQPQRTPSMGLWSPISAQEEDEDDEDAMVLNFGHEKHSSPAVSNSTTGATSSSGFENDASNALADLHLTSMPAQEITELDLSDQVKTPTAATVTTPSDMITPRADMGSPAGYFGPLTEHSPAHSQSADAGESGGLWDGRPLPPDEADALRDLSASKRRWTVTETSQL